MSEENLGINIFIISYILSIISVFLSTTFICIGFVYNSIFSFIVGSIFSIIIIIFSMIAGNYFKYFERIGK